MEKEGVLLITTVRDGPKLVGYCVMILGTNLHYMDVRCASNDVIYLSPEYREGKTGIKLIEFTENLLKGYVVTWHVKKKHPILGKLLAHKGYEDFEICYRKRI